MTANKTCIESGSLLGKKTLAKERKNNMNFYKAVFIYMLGGLVGTVYETILNLCRGDGFVFCNGSLFTPFNFVYGVGALVIILCLRFQTNPIIVWSMGALGGGLVEYILSFLEEKILGTHSWDYSDQLLNINGRTSVLCMAVWGLLCVFVIFLIYRPLDSLLNRIPVNILKTVAVIMAVIIAVDFIITVGALVRYTARYAGKEAVSGVGRLIDRLFGDEFMRLRFPKMNFGG